MTRQVGVASKRRRNEDGLARSKTESAGRGRYRAMGTGGSSAPRLLLVSGSPRDGGNTDILLGCIARAFRELGGKARVVHIRDLRVQYCLGCFSCQRQLLRPCVQQDDMQPLYDQLLAADAVVLGSPVYFWAVTAQMKTFLDRLFPFGDYQRTSWAVAMKGKPFGVVLVHADRDVRASGATLTQYELEVVIECIGGRVLGELRCAATDRGEVRKLSYHLQSARALGKALYREVARSRRHPASGQRIPAAGGMQDRASADPRKE